MLTVYELTLSTLGLAMIV